MPICQVETDPFDNIPMKSTVPLSMRLSFDEASEEEANWPRDRQAARLIPHLLSHFLL